MINRIMDKVFVIMALLSIVAIGAAATGVILGYFGFWILAVWVINLFLWTANANMLAKTNRTPWCVAFNEAYNKVMPWVKN